MITPQHTPAPWNWHRDRDRIGRFYKVTGSQGATVADMPVQPLDPESWAEAKARLIAAAPELLEALQWQEMAEADPHAARCKRYFDRARELRRSALANVAGHQSTTGKENANA